jgi:hypothetical protein
MLKLLSGMLSAHVDFDLRKAFSFQLGSEFGKRAAPA